MVEEAHGENYQAKAGQLSVEGQWTKWCRYVCMNLSWKTLLAMPQQPLSFCLSATYNTLPPSPSNLHRWCINSEASCLPCQKEVYTTAHILGACILVLQESCFTFRHDSALSVLVVALESFLSSKK